MGLGSKGSLEVCGERDPVSKLPRWSRVLLPLPVPYKKSHILRVPRPPSPQTTPFTLSREQQPSRDMLDNTSVSMALLPHPFEIQCKPINSTLLLVAAACMVWILSIRKTVNPAHLFTLTSTRHPACPYKYWKLVTCLLDHEKMEAYGRIHM